jgi:TRAP transporter TAXI family solute receptor
MAGDYDIALALVSVATDALNGTGLFDEPQPIRALTRLNREYVHVLVRTDARIETVADMRGKRVSVGTPKSGTEATAHQLLRAAGLDPGRNVQVQRLDLAKTADGLEAGTIDAFIWVGGPPVPKIAEITSSLRGEIKFLDVTPLISEMNEAGPVYETGVIPAELYGQPHDIPALVFHSLLVVRENFPADAACAVTKAIFENKDELNRIHPAAEEITLGTARRTEPVPLHPGAQQALDELHAPR